MGVSYSTIANFTSQYGSYANDFKCLNEIGNPSVGMTMVLIFSIIGIFLGLGLIGAAVGRISYSSNSYGSSRYSRRYPRYGSRYNRYDSRYYEYFDNKSETSDKPTPTESKKNKMTTVKLILLISGITLSALSIIGFIYYIIAYFSCYLTQKPKWEKVIRDLGPDAKDALNQLRMVKMMNNLRNSYYNNYEYGYGF